MATIWVEPPEGWGQRMKLATALERLGYHIETRGAGTVWVLVLS